MNVLLLVFHRGLPFICLLFHESAPFSRSYVKDAARSHVLISFKPNKDFITFMSAKLFQHSIFLRKHVLGLFSHVF